MRSKRGNRGGDAKRRRRIDPQISKAFGSRARALFVEIEPLIVAQAYLHRPEAR